MQKNTTARTKDIELPVDRRQLSQRVGPGVETIRGCHPTYRKLWKTIVRNIGNGFVVFPGWNPQIAFKINLPFVVWKNGRGHVAMNAGIDDCEWRLMVVAPIEFSNAVVDGE